MDPITHTIIAVGCLFIAYKVGRYTAHKEFDKFIKPSSLAKYVRDAEAELLETKGMFYNPLTHKANLNNDLGVNYLMYARKS